MRFGRRQQKASPADDPTSIGNLLVTSGFLSRGDLDRYLGEFESRVGEMLGRFLVSKGVLSEDRLRMVLLRQKILREGRVHFRHIEEAFKIAKETEHKVTQQLDRLIYASSRAVACGEEK